MATSLLVFGLSQTPDSKLVGKSRPDLKVERIDGETDWPTLLDRARGNHVVGLLGPQVEAPLTAAERLASVCPQADMIVVRPHAELRDIRNLLATHPRLARRTVVISEGEVVRLPSILESFIEAQRRSMRYRETVRRFNKEIPQPRPVAPDTAAYLNLVLEHAPIGVILLNGAGEIANANPEARRLLGGHADAPIGNSVEALLLESERKDWRRLLARSSLETGTRQSEVLAVGSEPAGLRYLSFIVTPARRMADVDGSLVLMQDLTEEIGLREMHRAAEERALDAQYAAEQASHAKTQFLANVSHELRTPMNAIIGFSEFIAMRLAPTGKNKTIVEYANIIHKAATHLSSLLEDILDVSSIELGYARINRTDFELWESVQDVIEVLDNRGRVSNVAIVAAPPKTRVRVFADPRAVRQIAMNLLSNALKFTPDGGSVRVSADVDGTAFARLSVQDTGIGIAAADIERIVMPFERAENAKSEDTPGTGLGLHLVNVLTRLNGGSLDIASELGVGTTVSVHLPLAND